MADGGAFPETVLVPFGHLDLRLSRTAGQPTWALLPRHGDGKPLMSGMLDGPDGLTERGLIELSATVGAFLEGS